MAKDETPAEKKLREELEKAASKVEPKNALPQIRARIKAKEEKGKKTKGEKRGKK